MNAEPKNPLPAHLTPAQRDLLRLKIHIDPGAQSNRRVLGRIIDHHRLPSAWTAALRLVDLLRTLPEDALRWWAFHPRGHVLITAADEGYCAGESVSGNRVLTATALLPIAAVVDEPARAAILALHPLDHLLGCGGDPDGRWLSDGSGCSPRWQAIGQQINALFPLGYGLSQTGTTDPHWYMAEGIWTALDDRSRLNVADPKLERLLHHSILDAGFWRNFLREDGSLCDSD